MAALRDGAIIHASPRFLALFGVGRDCAEEDYQQLAKLVLGARPRSPDAAGVFECTCTAQFFDGSTGQVELRGADCDVDGKPALVVVAHDVTGHCRKAARLSFLALHDPLTGLSNRSLMQDRLDQAVAAALRYRHRCAVLLVDLDGFKSVNDVHGHAAGDALLIAVAERLQLCARSSDTVARLGGDEFVLVLSPLGGYEDTALVAARVVESLAAGYQLDTGHCRLSASVGAALLPDNGRDAQTLLAHADAAMYIAKGAGKNRYSFPKATREMLHGIDRLEWGTDRDIGVDEVDAEHRELVERMNGMAAAIRAGADCRQLAAMLLRIMSFLRGHFATEERLMEHRPGAFDLAHRREHRRVLDDVERLTAVVDDQSIALAIRYVYDWLFRHVDAYDRNIGRTHEAE